MIYGGSQNKGEAQGEKGRRTLTMPSIPQAAAMTSPQYLSLHHDILQPPSAYQYVRCANMSTGRQEHTSRVPRPGRPGSWPCDACCCSACATRDTEFPSNVVDDCVGVATVTVCAIDREDGVATGRERTSTSSVSCHDERDGCSRQS